MSTIALYEKPYENGFMPTMTYYPCDDGNVDYIDNQKKLLKSMGLEDVEVLYAALLLAKAIRGDVELSQSIKDIAKTIIRKL